MTFAELIEQLKNFENTEDFENYVSGHVTTDRVKKFLETKEGKELIEPIASARFTKGLETWKKNNLEKEVNQRIKELYPDTDPKDAKVAELEATIKRMEAEKARADLTRNAMSIANKKGLPVDLVEFFIGADDEATKKNMEAFEKHFNAGITAGINKKLSDGNYIPPEGDSEPMDGVTKRFLELNPGMKITDIR